MTSPSSATDAEDEGPPPELGERDLARLRVAGAAARFAAGVGSLGLGLMLLVLLDVGLRNPDGLGPLRPRLAPAFFSNTSTLVGSAAGVALLWAFGRSVSAHFAGSDGALARAFRYLRFLFVALTCAAGAIAVSMLAALWQEL